MKNLIAISALCLLTACLPKAPIQTGSETKVFKILAINPPKHFYVDLKDKDGKIYQHVYVSKHCNLWREVKIGSEFTLTVKQFKRDNESWQVIEAGSVCPISK